jgi:hypothetical protein
MQKTTDNVSQIQNMPKFPESTENEKIHKKRPLGITQLTTTKNVRKQTMDKPHRWAKKRSRKETKTPAHLLFKSLRNDGW